MRSYAKSNLFYFIAVLLFCGLILPTAIFAQPEDDGEEEPVQTYPNPLENEISDAKAMQLMKSQLENMGFTVGQIQKVANGKFIANVQSWNQTKMKARFKGSVQSTGAKTKGARGTGKVTVTVNKSGIFFDNASFKAMGLKMNAAKLKEAAIVK